MPSEELLCLGVLGVTGIDWAESAMFALFLPLIPATLHDTFWVLSNDHSGAL